MPGPQDMTSIMSSDPWVDLLWPRHEREFFFEKPDTDLFFPILSRYHRGWLQIQPWPRHPDPIIHPSYAETRRLTGGDIPIEIVQRIAEVLSVKGASRLEPAAHKRDLAACALMCRAWVPICQAKLFDEITLRCARDVHELLDFLMDPTSNIRHYIQDLHIPPQALAGTPWIHHLSSLYPYLPNLPREIEGYRNIDSPIVHTVNGPLARGRGPLRSIHQALPRAPPIFSSYIQKLCLNKLHFRKFNDLADLVAELRDLRYLECDGLTIAGSLPRPSRALGFMPEIVMHDCNFSWASIWLFVGQRKGFSPWQERIDPDDDARIGELARTIGTGFEAVHTPLTSTSNRIAPSHGVNCKYHHGPFDTL
ncbi:hypothetical protein EIP86_005544 [Pleurotus ostreatoroseus]|nr:hypothetical protein EIP86_005544 [Pleurotus ostreatoroseus]